MLVFDANTRCLSTRCLSIRQPWAWLIVNGHKDIENRSWSTKYRGPLLIHASARKPPSDFLSDIERCYGVDLPKTFDLGGIVGLANVVDCVSSSPSVWMQGPVGWKLANAQTLPFLPVRGKLGLFRLEQSDLDLVRANAADPIVPRRTT